MVISWAPSSERRAALLAMTVSPLRGLIFRLGGEFVTYHPANLLLAGRAQGYILLASCRNPRLHICRRRLRPCTIGAPRRREDRIYHTKVEAKSFLGLDNRSCAPSQTRSLRPVRDLENPLLQLSIVRPWYQPRADNMNARFEKRDKFVFLEILPSD